jgi:serine/threonine-protein kinase
LILGTAAYMAPEQARGRPVDKRADIWAFGVVLHEMLTGRRLFDGKTVSDTLAAVLVKDADVSDAPQEVQPLLAACVERDVKRRLRDVGDVGRLLEEGRKSIAIRPQTRATRTPWVVAALLAAVAVTATWTAWRALQPQERALVRLPIDLGPDAGLVQFPTNDVAISPDGRYLAFANAGRNRLPAGRAGRGSTPDVPRARISVRRLDDDAVVELPGTESAFWLFFSPDSQWIAFSAQGRLNKISVTGSAVIPLADMTSFQGAFWIDQASIIVAGSIGGSGEIAFWRVPASGGSSKPEKVGPLNNRGLITQILPGGRHALAVGYTSLRGGIRSGNSDQATVEAVSLADGSRTPIIQGGVSPLYLPSGHLIYLTRGTLFAVRFDPDTLQTRGTAVPIIKDVQFNGARATLSFTQSGTLVYRSGAPTSSAGARTRVELVDASGAHSTLGVEPRGFQRPRFSPDGSKLAVLIDELELRDEWVLDLANLNLRRITFGGIPITTAAWSADGAYVMVGSGSEGIHVARADGGAQPQPLVDAKVEGLIFLGNYSPQTKRLTYFVANRQSVVATLPLSEDAGRLQAGKPEVLIQTQFQNVYPELSPDGRWLASATDETGRMEVNVRPFPIPASGPGTRVAISSSGGIYPRWSPAGNELLYESPGAGRIMSVRYKAEGGRFVVVGEPRVRVEKFAGSAGDWDIAKDGRIVMLTPVAEQQIAPRQPTVVYVENFFDELRRRVPVD